MIYNLADIDKISHRFIGCDLAGLFLGNYDELAASLVAVVITFGICRFMYQKKIFLWLRARMPRVLMRTAL